MTFLTHYGLNAKLELYNIQNVIKQALEACLSNFYYQASITRHNCSFFNC